MAWKFSIMLLVTLLAACGSEQSSEPNAGSAESRPTAFDPLTSTLDRAADVQKTIDQQAAEQRKAIEAAER